MYRSETKNLEILGSARRALTGKWLFAILMFIGLAFYEAGAHIVPIIGSLIVLLFAGPLAVGFNRFSLIIARGDVPEAGVVFSGFRQFWTNFSALILMFIFVILWCVLLVIPGIIKAFAYSQIFYVLSDHPELSALEAITKSREMMYGSKWKLFRLSLYLLLLAFLCVLTLGIGFIWYMPYQNVVLARFYDDLKIS